MYRMLIVDDEPEIVESLYELFMEAGFTQLDILKTYSSKDAVSIVSTTKIDILLTDIRMPGTNGLQLAEIVRNNWPKCRVVFLTGFNEFEYAYTAIKGDCEDYILKTENDREIIKSVQNAVAKLEKSFQEGELLDKARNQMRFVIPLLQKEFILDIIEGVVTPSQILQEKLDELEIGLKIDSKLFVFLGRVDEVPKRGTNNFLESEYKIAIKFVFEEALLRYPHKVIVEVDSTSFICIIQDEADINNLNDNNEHERNIKNISIIKGATETIQNICRKSLDITLSFVLCSEAIDWETLFRKFLQLKKIMDFSSGIGSEAFLTDKSFSNGIFERISSYNSELMENEISNTQNISALASYIERGMQDEYYQMLSKIIDCIKNVNSKNNNLALEIYYSVANCLLSYINRCKISDSIAFKIGLYKLTRVDEHNSWNDAVEYIYELSKVIFETQKGNQDKMASASVKYIQQYIQQYIQNHINDDLSLTKLAELVFFNPSYLSRLFKKVTSMNLSDYIMEARVAKAKILLVQNELKIHELVEMLGLESPTYFGRIFKKATNMTPQEYRESFYKR